MTSPDRCSACDYDLTGTLGAGGERCPECGAPLSAAGIALARERTQLRAVGWWIGAAVILLVAATLVSTLLSAERALFVMPGIVLLGAPLVPVLAASWCAWRMP